MSFVVLSKPLCPYFEVGPIFIDEMHMEDVPCGRRWLEEKVISTTESAKLPSSLSCSPSMILAFSLTSYRLRHRITTKALSSLRPLNGALRALELDDEARVVYYRLCTRGKCQVVGKNVLGSVVDVGLRSFTL